MGLEGAIASTISEVGLWWPLADEGQLQKASAAYERIATTTLAAAATGTSGAKRVSANHGQGVDAFTKYWAKYDGAASAGLPATAKAASSVAKALQQFADKVVEAKNKIKDLAIEIAATLAAGAALSLFTAFTSAGVAAARVAMLVARGAAVGLGLSGVAAALAAPLLVIVAGGALSGFIGSIVAQVAEIALTDGKGIDLGKAMESAAWGAAGAPVAVGAGAAVRSAFHAMRPGASIAGRFGPASRMAGGETGVPGGVGWQAPEGLKGINPTGSQTNCINCAVATDNLLAGKGLVPAKASAATKTQQLERLYGGRFQSVADRRDLIRSMQEAGPGSRVIVSRVNVTHKDDLTGLGRPLGHGHAFNAYVDDVGNVRFVDGQTGRQVRVWPVQAHYKILWTHKP